MKRIVYRVGVAGIVAVALLGCQSHDTFVSVSSTEYFVQNYHPPQLDVLWVVDNRSPMYRVRTHLNQEAAAFFQRLDASTASDYRMGVVTADMQYSNGDLFPKESPVVLTKGLGTLSQRTTYFANLLTDVINLRTGAVDQSFASALAALKRTFVPRPFVPLVLVFLSDSDDHSSSPTEAVSYYSAELLALKGNDSDQLRVYSVNYIPVPNGQPAAPYRCATQFNADIDRVGFENRFFRLADSLTGDTSNLCESFAGNIDLSGLKLTQPLVRFVLVGRPDPSGITVTVSLNQQAVSGLKWKYEASSNSIVFDSAPPEGATIQVTYLPSK
jgi:hypothetical protein